MATWPSGSKASTTNLDAGTDKPSLARSDIKQNVDNVNAIIDMFNISTHTSGDILVWDSGNSRFTVSTPVDQGITSVVAGTGISVDQTSDGGVTVTNTAPATGNELENVVEDTTPQLGGNLDVNGNSIVSASNGDISITPNGTGNIVLDGQNWPQAAPATNDEYLTATSAGQLSWTDRVNAKTIYETVKNDSGGSLTKGTPVYQKGISGNTITVAAARADDIDKLAIGVLDETLADQAEGRMIVLGEIKNVNTASFATGDRIYLGETGGYTNTPPTGSAVARQFLGVVNRVDASTGSGYITGTLLEDAVKWTGTIFQFWDGNSWETLPYISDVVTDTTPQLGGDLDVQTFKLVSTSNGNIELAPDGTGDVYLTADTVRVGDSNANATITTNGTGDLILNTNAGSSSGSITIEDGSNGDITLAPTGTGRVEIPGTVSQSGGIRLFEELTSAGNTNSVVLRAPQILQADVTLTLPSTVTSGTLGYLNVPAVGTKTGSYTLTTADVGEYVQVGSGGSITIPNSTFAEGDVVLIVNNHTAAITITCSITDAYIAGTDTDKASVSLATRGVASLFFVSGTRVIISGNVT